MNKVREWKKFLIPYEQAVEELKVKFKSIRDEYRELNDYSPIEFVTGRVKRISSILEKAKRRNIPEDQIVQQMEDIAGIRIMCQFKDDIYKVVDLIKERDGKDLKVAYEKDYITNFKDSGYRSYHMILKYPVYTAFGQRDILVEIQIRTLAMNFWATIEHSLNYKYASNIPENIKVRLRRAAEAATILDNEMMKIRKEVINAQLLFEEKSNTVMDITENINILSASGNPELASSFQEEFDSIWEYGSHDQLTELLAKIKKEMPRYKIFENNFE
jgi:putative GTP pyrophosphokinase